VEANSIDTKVDDGLAAYGDVFFINQQADGGSWETTGCLTGGDLLAAPSAIDWDLSNDSTENCVMIYYLK